MPRISPLGTQLRTKFKPRIEDYKIYRIYPGGDTEFLHPKDGVFPEKVKDGRPMVGHNPRRIGENPNPANPAKPRKKYSMKV